MGVLANNPAAVSSEKEWELADRPDAAFLWKLAIAAIAIRLIFLAATPLITHRSISDFMTWNDTLSYIQYAQKMDDRRIELSQWDQRVFPGYPAAIFLVHKLHISWLWSALGIALVSSPIAIVSSAALFRSKAVGLAMLFIPPEWFLASISGVSEPLMMALMLPGVLLHMRGRSLAGGILLGLAGTVRPMACFAVAGCMLVELIHRRWGRLLKVALPALAIVALAVVGVKLLLGSATQTVQSYNQASAGHWGGSMFSWPFSCLIVGPRLAHPHPAIHHFLHAWGSTVMVLLGCALLLKSRNSDLGPLSIPWLWGNTLFVLCVGGSVGFFCLPRYIIPALPPMFYAYRPWLCRWRWVWPVLAVGMAGAMYVMVHHFAITHQPL